MILLNETVAAGPFMVIYKDSDNPKHFYYTPNFAEVAKQDNGKLLFAQTIFERDINNPADGFSDYRFIVRAAIPSKELSEATKYLETNYGTGVSISPIPAHDISISIVHLPISHFLIHSSVQSRGANIMSDMGVGFTFPEDVEPKMSGCFKGPDANLGFIGEIKCKLQGLVTPFKAKIEANWHSILTHFKAQSSVKHWFVRSNISYETQKLIEKGDIKIQILGGSPAQKDYVYSLATKIVTRLFVRTVMPTPFPSHPNGGIVSHSVNYAKVEENKSEVWTIEEKEYETRDIGIVVIVNSIPEEYFDDTKTAYSLNLPLEVQAVKRFENKIANFNN